MHDPEISQFIGLCASLTRRFAGRSIRDVQSLQGLEFSPPDTRDRYLARPTLMLEALWRQGARRKRRPRRRARRSRIDVAGFLADAASRSM